MMMGKGKGLALLLDAPKGKGEMDDEEAPASEQPEGGDFDDAAKDAFEAAKADDAEAFSLALRRAIEAC